MADDEVEWGAWEDTEDGRVAIGVLDLPHRSAAVSIEVPPLGEPLVETCWYGGTGDIPAWLDRRLRNEATAHLELDG